MKEKLKRVAIHTLGCKLNQTEAMSMRYLLSVNGYEVVDKFDIADIYIINTCTVTAKSDTHACQYIRRIIKQNPKAYIVVAGCYPQVNSEMLSKISGIDAIIGNIEKKDILKFIENPVKKDRPMVCTSDISNNRDFDSSEYSIFGSYTRAFVKIQEGCDSSCSYCIVKIARGPNRSGDPDRIIERIRILVDSGYKEFVLTGVHLGTYGLDLSHGWSLTKLLERICKIESLPRIRLSSIEPTEFTDELIELITSEKKIAKHFHIPLQSGSMKILGLMQRTYSPAFYASIVNKIKSRSPDAAIGADVLVGFPNENDSDFNQTLDLIKKIPISYLHVFPYSKRPMTIAAAMENQVDLTVKKERSSILRSLGKTRWKEFCSTYLNQDVDFLILSSRDKATSFLRGLSHNYLKVLVDGDDSIMNSFQCVHLTEFRNGTLLGNIDKPS
jgi:threonylcarbamoyladenosine tRNA methylthiotransferase MtaB